jgi:ketosteroid isomerase-like protein
MTDEAAIRELIIRWADAVHRGDLDSVLADYRDSWRPFFEYQRAPLVPAHRLVR